MQTKDLVSEDEVKVHATGDIEEGEISSDEEGEIKGEDVHPYSWPHPFCKCMFVCPCMDNNNPITFWEALLYYMLQW